MKKELDINTYDLNQITINYLWYSKPYKVRIIFKADRILVYKKYPLFKQYIWLSTFNRGVLDYPDSIIDCVEDISNRLRLMIKRNDIEKSAERLLKRRKKQ